MAAYFQYSLTSMSYYQQKTIVWKENKMFCVLIHGYNSVHTFSQESPKDRNLNFEMLVVLCNNAKSSKS